MSIRCKYLTCEKLDLEQFRCVGYACDDMSVEREKDKTYSVTEYIDKEDPRFGYIQLYYYTNPLLYVTTPPMKCLFGVKKKGKNNFEMNLQFTDYEEDSTMGQFFEFIQGLEFHVMKQLGLTEEDADRFVSQIKYDREEKYDPNLCVKLPFFYNRFSTDLYSDYSSAVNIFRIRNFAKMECDIYIDKIWKFNDQFYMKWKCKVIHLL